MVLEFELEEEMVFMGRRSSENNMWNVIGCNGPKMKSSMVGLGPQARASHM